MKKIIIAVDAMGGDNGVTVTVPAALTVLKKYKNLHLILVGNETKIKEQLRISRFRNGDRLDICHATQEVAMDELPSKALRTKKDSSMRVGINLVKNGTAQACVSAGNTGALMATARYVLKTLPGVDRPAIIATFPSFDTDKNVWMLDLGANVDSCADHLYQFAIMGTVLVSTVKKIEKPKIGLLNIGEEEIKGNDQVKRTAQLLTESKNINYYGYIEGNDIFTRVVDIVVCDGFTGNVALKSMEGMTKLITHYIKKEIAKNLYSRIIALLTWPIMRRVKKQLDPGRYNGASLIGLQGIVIKSHGDANQAAFANAIEEAVSEVEQDVPHHIGEKVAAILGESAEF